MLVVEREPASEDVHAADPSADHGAARVVVKRFLFLLGATTSTRERKPDAAYSEQEERRRLWKEHEAYRIRRIVLPPMRTDDAAPDEIELETGEELEGATGRKEPADVARANDPAREQRNPGDRVEKQIDRIVNETQAQSPKGPQGFCQIERAIEEDIRTPRGVGLVGREAVEESREIEPSHTSEQVEPGGVQRRG